MLGDDKPHKVEKRELGFTDGFIGQLTQAHKGIERQIKEEPVVTGDFGEEFERLKRQASKRFEREVKNEPVVIATIPHTALGRKVPEFPLICDKNCPFTQCSSWGVEEMQGQPCRNRTKTNDEISPPQKHQFRMVLDGMEG